MDGRRPAWTSRSAGSGVGHTFGQSAPAIATRMRWPAGNRQPVASTSIVELRRSPGSSGSGSVSESRRVPLSIPLATSCERAVGRDVGRADREAHDARASTPRAAIGPRAARGSSAAPPAARGCRPASAPRRGAGRPAARTARRPTTGRRSCRRSGRTRQRRRRQRPRRSGVAVEQPPSAPSVEDALRARPAAARPSPRATRPASSSRSGASGPASCMKTATGGSAMIPVSMPAAPVVQPADHLAQVVDPRAGDRARRGSAWSHGPISSFFGAGEPLEQPQRRVGIAVAPAADEERRAGDPVERRPRPSPAASTARRPGGAATRADTACSRRRAAPRSPPSRRPNVPGRAASRSRRSSASPYQPMS